MLTKLSSKITMLFVGFSVLLNLLKASLNLIPFIPFDFKYTDVHGKHVIVHMTAQEVCQLIHSYVDSSFMQKHQNFTSLIVLIDSKVAKNYEYHNADKSTETPPAAKATSHSYIGTNSTPL